MPSLRQILSRLFNKPSPKAEKKKSAPKPPKPKKPDPFLDAIQAYDERLTRFWSETMPATDSAKGEIAFLVTPWLGSAVPMFVLETALLVRRTGRRVRLILDDADISQNAMSEKHRAALRSLVQRASVHAEIIDVSSLPEEDGTSDMPAAKRMCENLAIWWERGESGSTAFFDRNPHAIERTAAHLAKVRKLMQSLRPHRTFIPGGFFGLSGVYRFIAQELTLGFTTFDGNAKMLMVSKDAIAGHRKDLGPLFKQVEQSLTPGEWNKVCAIADEELDKRMHKRDTIQYQVCESSATTTESYDILVPLNLRWDASSLDCELSFPSCTDWLVQLLDWVDKDGRFSICLREHPVGRLAIAKSADDYGPVIARFARLGKRLRHIKPEEPVNTYDLMRGCKLVLPYNSTVGIEAAMLGIPVIAHTTVYYRDMGFGWGTDSSDDYFRTIASVLEGSLVMSDDRRQKAHLAFYLTQCCSFLLSNFNCYEEPYARWVTMPPDEVLAEGGRSVVRALIEDGDVPMYLHQENMSREVATSASTSRG